MYFTPFVEIHIFLTISVMMYVHVCVCARVRECTCVLLRDFSFYIKLIETKLIIMKQNFIYCSFYLILGQNTNFLFYWCASASYWFSNLFFPFFPINGFIKLIYLYCISRSIKRKLLSEPLIYLVLIYFLINHRLLVITNDILVKKYSIYIGFA